MITTTYSRQILVYLLYIYIHHVNKIVLLYNDRKIKTKHKVPRLPYATVSQYFHSESARCYYKQRLLADSLWSFAANFLVLCIGEENGHIYYSSILLKTSASKYKSSSCRFRIANPHIDDIRDACALTL